MVKNDKTPISFFSFTILSNYSNVITLIGIIGLILASAFVPLIYHLKIITLEGNALEYWTQKKQAGTFSHTINQISSFFQAYLHLQQLYFLN